MQNTKNHRKIDSIEFVVPELRTEYEWTESETDSETSCRLKENRTERKGEERTDGEMSVKRTETKRARVPEQQHRDFIFPIQTLDRESALYLSIVIVLLTRELSLVAPRMASVGLADAGHRIVVGALALMLASARAFLLSRR